MYPNSVRILVPSNRSSNKLFFPDIFSREDADLCGRVYLVPSLLDYCFPDIHSREDVDLRVLFMVVYEIIDQPFATISDFSRLHFSGGIHNGDSFSSCKQAGIPSTRLLIPPYVQHCTSCNTWEIQIWKYPKLWVGFMKCALLTKPQSFGVLLQVCVLHCSNSEMFLHCLLHYVIILCLT